ncbi:putative cytokinetic ring protein SteA [Aquipuribacter nitratireducens]|uniref:Cytokinetic ring protein SteA n=1 Tax=Aquipuribacter nitratireducens TaxID=650104 RepID=A0ABW0GQ29_9MICO
MGLLRVAGRRPRVEPPGTVGPARVLRDGARSARRVRPGDVVVLDAPDLDAATAEELLRRRPAAVLNAAASSTGRQPTLGPRLLVDAAVPLVDELGPGLLLAVRDGDRVHVDGGCVRVGAGRRGRGDDAPPLVGRQQDDVGVELAYEHARRGVVTRLEGFAAATAGVLDAERDLLLEGYGLPALPLRLAGRPVVVVAQGYGWADDLRALRRFLLDRRPVLVGVDDGADALLAVGRRPDVVVTDGRQASDEALTCGAHVVAHVPPDHWAEDGVGPGGVPAARRAPDEDPLERLTALGVAADVVPCALTSEDLAVLLAHHHDARTIVTAGSHATLEELLDRGRTGAASAFLARLRAGAAVVDATTAADLHQPRVSWGLVVLLVLAGVAALAAAVAATPWGQEQLGDAATSLTALLPRAPGG